MPLFVIEGCGDVGSAIAHQLFNYSQSVLITDHDRPAADQIDKLSNFLLDNCCGGKPCMTPVRKKKESC